jgi:lipocalin
MNSVFVIIVLFVGALLPTGAVSFLPNCPDTVKDLDLKAYSGLWFEMYNNALSAYTFERDCECVTALVSLLLFKL